jgi:hypothetical protein
MFGITHATNAAVIAQVQANVSAGFEFSRVTIGGSYPTRANLPSIAPYSPLSYAVPFGINSSQGVPFLMFSYMTTNPTDPGRFVSIIP